MDRNRYQGVENPSHKRLKQISVKTKRVDSSQVNLNQSKTMGMGGPGKGGYRMYDHQKKLSSIKPSRSKPSAMPSRYLRMQDEEIHVEEPRNSFSPPQSLGKRVRTRNHDEEYLQEHNHESETRNSFSPPQSHGRRVRFRNQYEEYPTEQDYEGDSVKTGTYMSDDEEDNIGSTSHDPLVEEFCELTGMSSDKVHLSRSSVSLSKMKEGKARRQRHGIKIKVASPGSASVGAGSILRNLHSSKAAGTTVTRKETRALGETRKSRLNKGKLVFEVDECFGKIVGNDSQHFITKGGCVMRKYAKFDGTTWKKQPEDLKTDIISKTTENSNFDSKCRQMNNAMSSQLGYQHRNRQWRLHLQYQEYETKEEAMTHPPDGIDVSDWVQLCERFASEKFQKLSNKNKKNRSMNEIPPTVGSHSIARTVDTSRREGKEITETQQWRNAHYSEERKAMINEKADILWNKIQTEEATSSSTSAEICLKHIGHLPGHIKGRCASTKQILETVNLRSELKIMKESHFKLQEETKATNAKVDFLLEEMKKMSQLLQQFQNHGEI